jgi:hypothetical protein
MYRFWKGHAKPIIEILEPGRILEIGAEFGQNTERLLEYCRHNGAQLDVVEPEPTEALRQVLARYPAEHSLHACKSLNAIPNLAPADLVMLDGDHNWFTVYNELQQLYLRAETCDNAPPVVLLHDIAWPYARRDMYYDPGSIGADDRHPYAFRGILPEQPQLSDSGVNGRFANAMHEGGLRNGVLTAVEDFRVSCGVDTSLHLLPFFNGMGILVPDARMTPALQAVIDGFFSPESLLETCRLLERNVMTVRAELAALETVLSNRTAALGRLREQIVTLHDEKNGAWRERLARARNWTCRLRSRIAGLRP